MISVNKKQIEYESRLIKVVTYHSHWWLIKHKIIMKEDFEEKLRLHKDYSVRFSNYVLKSLIEENGDKQNIALAPSRLQATLVLLGNWTTPNISRWILDQTVSDVIDIEEANLLFNSNNTQPVPHNETFRDIDGNPIQMVPIIEQQTTLWYKDGLAFNSKAIDNITDNFHFTFNAVDFPDANIKKAIDEEVCKGTHGLIEHLDTKLMPSMPCSMASLPKGDISPQKMQASNIQMWANNGRLFFILSIYLIY